MRALLLALGLGLLALAALPAAVGAAPLNAATCAEVSISASAGGTSVFAVNAARRLLLLHNIDDQAISCQLEGETPVTTDGIYLGAGGAWTFDVVVPGGAVRCISHSGTKKLRACEGV